MSQIRFLCYQAAIFASVKIPLYFTPANGFMDKDWSWAFAYGALLILPLIIFWHKISLRITLIAITLSWIYGQIITAGFIDGYDPLICTYMSVAVLSVICKRYVMAAFSVLIGIYTIRIIGVEVLTEDQIGIWNLMFAALVLHSRIEYGKPKEGDPADACPQEEREAA